MMQTSVVSKPQEAILRVFSERSNYETLLEYSRRQFRSLEAAEDAIQDVFVKLWEAAGKGQNLLPEKPEEAILYSKRALRNQFLMSIRKKEVRGNRSLEEEKDSLPVSLDEQGRVERYSLALEQLNVLIKRKVFLTEQQEKLWQLMQEFTPVEGMVKELGISKQNVYSQRNQLIAKIRRHIKKEEVLF